MFQNYNHTIKRQFGMIERNAIKSYRMAKPKTEYDNLEKLTIE